MILDSDYIKKNYEAVKGMLVLWEIQKEFEKNKFISSINIDLAGLAVNTNVILDELKRLELGKVLKICKLNYVIAPEPKDNYSLQAPYLSPDEANLKVMVDSFDSIEPIIGISKKETKKSSAPKKVWNGIATIEILLDANSLKQEYKEKIKEFSPPLEQLSLGKQKHVVEEYIAKKRTFLGKNKMVFSYNDMPETFQRFWLRDVNLFFVLLWLENEGNLTIHLLEHNGNPYHFEIELSPYLHHGALTDSKSGKKNTFTINLKERSILFGDDHKVALKEGEQFYELLEILMFEPNDEINNKELALRLLGALDGGSQIDYNNKVTKMKSRIRSKELKTKKGGSYDIFKSKKDLTSLKGI